MIDVRIGSGSEHVHLQLPVHGEREGWLQGQVAIAVRGFEGTITAFFEPFEFQTFEKELRSLYSTLRGTAVLRPREEQLVVTLAGNDRGGINVTGHAWSEAVGGNKLEFTFEIDQTFLPVTIAQLEALNAEWSSAAGV